MRITFAISETLSELSYCLPACHLNVSPLFSKPVNMSVSMFLSYCHSFNYFKRLTFDWETCQYVCWYVCRYVSALLPLSQAYHQCLGNLSVCMSVCFCISATHPSVSPLSREPVSMSVDMFLSHCHSPKRITFVWETSQYVCPCISVSLPLTQAYRLCLGNSQYICWYISVLLPLTQA